jgi:hypothetical protein
MTSARESARAVRKAWVVCAEVLPSSIGSGAGGVDLTVQLIRKGQVATFELAGDFRRMPAPSDGLLLETTTTTILVHLDDLRRAGLDVRAPLHSDARVVETS